MCRLDQTFSPKIPIGAERPTRAAYSAYCDRVLRHLLDWMFKAISSAPIPGLSLQESTHSAKVSFMSQKISLFGSFRPELDCVGQRVHRLMMTPNETSAKIDVLEVVLLGLQIRDLADVVAGDSQHA